MPKQHVLLTVRTAEGRRIVTPTGSAVPTAGFRIDPRDPWWARALASGDIVELGADDRAQSEADQPNSSGTVRSEEKN